MQSQSILHVLLRYAYITELRTTEQRHHLIRADGRDARSGTVYTTTMHPRPLSAYADRVQR